MSVDNSTDSHPLADEDTESTDDMLSPTNAIGHNQSQNAPTPVLSSTEEFSSDDEESMSSVEPLSPTQLRRISLEERINSTLGEIFWIVDEYAHHRHQQLRIDLMELMQLLVHLMRQLQELNWLIIVDICLHVTVYIYILFKFN